MMKYKIMIIVVLLTGLNGVMATEDPKTEQKLTGQVPATASKEAAVPEAVKLEDIQLPPTDNPEYWVVRSEAMSDLTPLLTKKRAEMKQKRQMLADYLLKIGKGEEMAAAQIEVPDDPALYAKALGLTDGLEQRDVTIPKKTPTWDELAEFSMRCIIYDGYVPVELDGVEDVTGFVEVVKKKEAYAQKVRKEMRGYVQDCLKMWIYLGQIGEQAAAKEWAVQMKVDAEKGKAAERAMLAEERRTANLNRMESEKQREFEDAQSRASFRSGRNERVYNSRQDQRQYQQTLLNERYTNYYRW
jgi:uncharacterized phage-like protein YoqJ